MAVGLSQAGVGIGQFIFAALNGYLISEYGLPGTLLILTAISLNVIPLGVLLHMPVYNKCTEFISNEKKGEREALMTHMPSSNSKKTTSSISKISSNSKQSDNQASEQKSESGGNSFTSCLNILGLDLFYDKYFTLLIVFGLLNIVPHYFFPTVITDHVLWIGGSQLQADGTLMVIGLANTCSRLFVWNISRENVLIWMDVLAISSLISGASLACTVFYHKYWMYVILCVLFGVTRGILVIYYQGWFTPGNPELSA